MRMSRAIYYGVVMETSKNRRGGRAVRGARMVNCSWSKEVRVRFGSAGARWTSPVPPVDRM